MQTGRYLPQPPSMMVGKQVGRGAADNLPLPLDQKVPLNAEVPSPFGCRGEARDWPFSKPAKRSFGRRREGADADSPASTDRDGCIADSSGNLLLNRLLDFLGESANNRAPAPGTFARCRTAGSVQNVRTR